MSDKDSINLLVREVFDRDSSEFIKQIASKQPNGKYKITFDLSNLETSSSPLGLTDKIYDKPSEYVDLFREISLDFVNKYLAFEKVDSIDFYFKVSKNRVINPSNLHVSYGNKLIGVHGLVVASGILEPLCVSSTFTCLTCANEMIVKHGLQRNNIKKCDNPSCGSTSIVEESAVFTDLKAITIQDALHKDSDSSENIIPTPIGIMLKDGLAFTKIKNGDIINVSGILKPFQVSPKSSHYKYLLIGTDVEIEGQSSLVVLTKEDIANIIEVSGKDNVLDLLADSLAPSIYNSGNILDIKRGLLLQAVGGVDLILPDGKRNRGQIHCFLCGDPSTAKSTLLRQMQNIIPNTIYTQGKGNTSVGLCVAPDSIILNKEGFRRISDIIEEKFDYSIAKEEITGAYSNDVILDTTTLNNDLRIIQTKTNKIWKIIAPSKMIIIKTRSGKKISLTENTPLLSIKNGRFEWIQSINLKNGDFVATSRKLPEGILSYIPTISILSDKKTIRITNDITDELIKTTNNLLKKHKSIQNIAKYFSIQRDKLYLLRTKKFASSITLPLFMRIELEDGKTPVELAKLIKTLAIRNGKNISIPENLIDKDIAYLAGLMIGDGDVYVGKNQNSMRLGSIDKQIIDTACNILKNKFSIIATRGDNGHGVTTIRFSSLIIYEIFKQYGLDKEKMKISIPPLVSEMPNEIIASLLRGLFDTDGWVTDKNSKHVGFSTISNDLAKMVQLCLLKFGVISSFRERELVGRVGYSKKIRKGGIISRHNQFYIEIHGNDNLDLFCKQIGFGLDRKMSKLIKMIRLGVSVHSTNVDVIPNINELVFPVVKQKNRFQYLKRQNMSRQKLDKLAKETNNPTLNQIATSDIFWDKIVAIDDVAPDYKYVYDFSVKPTHNFVVNGFIVHNTATVNKDEITGRWMVQAGAAILADGGLLILDEMDNTNKEDLNALNESSESGRVSINKAGIHQEFKTTYSLLAAANPKMGRFDPMKSVVEQLTTIPPPLLSRFDLRFMLYDIPNQEQDMNLAEHIGKGYVDSVALKPIFDRDFLMKYILYARMNCKPQLTKEAMSLIKNTYVSIRNIKTSDGRVPLTPRQLEGMIRLSVAVAKVRLSPIVEEKDVKNAFDIFKSTVDGSSEVEWDADQIEGRISAKKRNKMQFIIDYVKEKSQVKLDDLISYCKQNDIDNCEELVDYMRRQGILYEIMSGVIGVV